MRVPPYSMRTYTLSVKFEMTCLSSLHIQSQSDIKLSKMLNTL